MPYKQVKYKNGFRDKWVPEEGLPLAEIRQAYEAYLCGCGVRSVTAPLATLLLRNCGRLLDHIEKLEGTLVELKSERVKSVAVAKAGGSKVE